MNQIAKRLPPRDLAFFINGFLLALVVGLALLMAVALLPGLAGFTPLVVVSGSMEPTIHVGDVAVVRRIDPATLELGDVVTYRGANGTLITHRIVGVDVTPRGPVFHMKGDANATEDASLIPAEQVVAKVVYRLPRLGFLIAFTDSSMAKVLLVVVPALVLGLMWFRDRAAKAGVQKAVPHGASSDAASNGTPGVEKPR